MSLFNRLRQTSRARDPAWLILPAVLLATWWVWAAPGVRLLGHSLCEAPSHLWIQWLLDRAALGDGRWVGQEDIILGVPLWLLPNDPLTRMVAGPLGWVVGDVAAYNLCSAALLGLAGFGVLRLARILGAGPWPSTLASVLVIWSPSLLGYAADGRIDSMGVGWIALLAGSWVLAMRRRSWRAGLGLGVSGILVVISGPNMALVTAMCMAIPTVIAVVIQPRRMRPVLVAVALMALPAAATVTIWYTVNNQAQTRLSESWTPPAQLIFEASEATYRDAHDSWVVAWTQHRRGVQNLFLLPDHLQTDTAEVAWTAAVASSVAPGGWWWPSWTAAALVAIGLLRRRPTIWLLGSFAVVAQFVAAGHGAAHTVALTLGQDRFFYMAPGALLAHIPVLCSFTNYGLFGICAAGAAACAAALTLTELRGALAIGLLALAAWVVEVQAGPVPLPLPATVIERPSMLAEGLEGLPEDKAVMALPLGKSIGGTLQAWHQHPEVLRFWPIEDAGSPYRMLADPDNTLSIFIDQALGMQPPSDGTRDALWARGVGAVVVAPNLMDAGLRQQVLANLDQLLGPHLACDPLICVYRTDPLYAFMPRR
jgi:hypothetical protein